MEQLKTFTVWFITGSQHLYGTETLEQVAAHSKKIVETFNRSANIPVTIEFKPVLITAEAIHQLCLEANADKTVVGMIAWMHTFSPAKMWIRGLSELKKPFLHLHTQYNRDIPWNEIDMDFMNLNQSAHGDREFGFIGSRMRLNRKVVVGHFEDASVQQHIGSWARAACAWHDMQGMKVARFGDNMRDVAVTEGDKVEAQLRLGYDVYGYGVGDLVDVIHTITAQDIEIGIDQLLASYSHQGKIDRVNQHEALAEAVKIELGMRKFLKDGGFKAFTTTFENLHGLTQLPGIAVQRLMADGYGFGAEGDWKTAALVRAMKVMGAGLEGGTSFMEDYTYHLDPAGMRVLGAHMLEVCPSIASGKPSLEIHPLGIGGKADPVRLVFSTRTGNAVNASLMDMGNRFRLLVNPVDVVEAPALPKLPVARVLWNPRPNLQVAAAAWIYAGGAHHTGFSQSVTPEMLEDFAEMADIECLLIDENTTIHQFKNEIRWNEMYYLLNKALR